MMFEIYFIIYILYLSMFAHGGVGGDQHDAAQQQKEEAQHRGPALGGVLLGSWGQEVMSYCHTNLHWRLDSYIDS